MMPTEKTTKAKGPANGSSAAAACAAVWTLVFPWAWRTAAEVRMMKYITRLENAMPMRMSARAARSSASLRPRRPISGWVAPAALSSSTSDEACQKKR